jgi:hypothetical protein
MKRHVKRHANTLYRHKMKSGGAWKTTRLLRHVFLKKLTPIIRLVETSLLCTELGLTSTFPTSCFSNGSLVLASTSY